jgi:hypothetical protein
MAAQVFADYRLIEIKENGEVLYSGRAAGRIWKTDKTFCDGREPIWMNSAGSEVFYSKMGAAYDLAQRLLKRGGSNE